MPQLDTAVCLHHMLYSALVRPQLQFCVQVLGLPYKKIIDILSQQRAAKMNKGLYVEKTGSSSKAVLMEPLESFMVGQFLVPQLLSLTEDTSCGLLGTGFVFLPACHFLHDDAEITSVL